LTYITSACGSIPRASDTLRTASLARMSGSIGIVTSGTTSHACEIADDAIMTGWTIVVAGMAECIDCCRAGDLTSGCGVVVIEIRSARGASNGRNCTSQARTATGLTYSIGIDIFVALAGRDAGRQCTGAIHTRRTSDVACAVIDEGTAGT
jgi:hypothetical protein